MSSIFVFAALPCEAKPLIRHWRLKKHPNKHPFEIYADDLRVVAITGMGKVAMAGAVGYVLAAFGGEAHPILLNFGIAGHPRQPLGALYLVDKITDSASGKIFYPQMPFATACQTAMVTTQSKPESDYREMSLFDMEASAFYEMAVKFSSCELIHCLKVVSDNADTPLAHITEAGVETACETQLGAVDELLKTLQELRSSMPVAVNNALYAQLRVGFHYSATNDLKLKALLGRWTLLMGDQPWVWPEDVRSAKELINWLEKRLEQAAFCL